MLQGNESKGRCPMIHLGHQTPREETGFVVKHCVLCLTNRLHAVEVSSSELAGIRYGTTAFLICGHCGLERQVGGSTATAVIETAVSRSAILETLDPGYIEGEIGDDPPAGIEWLRPEDEASAAA
jgi:hypothetical protein